MNVKEFDHYLSDLVCESPKFLRDHPAPHAESWFMGFWCAISIIRKFLRENLHHEEKAS